MQVLKKKITYSVVSNGCDLLLDWKMGGVAHGAELHSWGAKAPPFMSGAIFNRAAREGWRFGTLRAELHSMHHSSHFPVKQKVTAIAHYRICDFFVRTCISIYSVNVSYVRQVTAMLSRRLAVYKIYEWATACNLADRVRYTRIKNII